MRNALSSPGIAVVIDWRSAGRDACGSIIPGPSQPLSPVDLIIGENHHPIHQTAKERGLPRLLWRPRLIRFEVTAERVPAMLEFQSECEVRIIASLHCIELQKKWTDSDECRETLVNT